MKSFLLVVLLACASPVARAQTYYLDLTYQTLNVPTRMVAVDKVIDGRAGHPPIGIVYRGLAGKSAAVAFRQGLETDLTNFVQAQLPARPTDHAVVLCLRTLHIGETMGGNKEQATADLTADVYARIPEGYQFVQSVGAHASAFGRETTGLHAGHVAQLLSQCFNQLNQANWAAVASQPVRTLAELLTDVPAPLTAGGRRGPAILREAPRRGIYYRFEQFLTNQPDTLSAFVVDTIWRRYKSPLAALQWQQVARVKPRASAATGGYTLPEELWGFSDGHQAFVRYDKQFFPLMRQGNFFTFVGEAPVDQLYAAAEAQAQGRAAVLAGAVGAALARTRGINHTAEPMPYGLDLRTGAIGPYPGLHTPVRSDTAYLYVYRLPQATDAAPLQVYADGRAMGLLGPGQYLELPWSRFGKPLQVCLGDWPVAKPCQFVVPNTTQLNYLKINAPNAPQPWQWMPPAQGSADLDELDKQRP